ncbi:MFS sugar transporter [Aspergillus campestris IBT 28561]|uniref:MFS sugar transporter n=1 Tax=Aspergillus campestris (strain IBT 28561) TaxID=1392248 RepID=A0A2I1D529_ASPC2|nr:MFS sugar transporter [Aspergillus campestris IBT 28561]PKY04980.1 MFS sugar transporter [Aspergillus campestris IBT 28561]
MPRRNETSTFGDRIAEHHGRDIEFENLRKETTISPHLPGNAADHARRNLNAKLANPLAGFTQEELRKQGVNFAIKHCLGDEEDIRAFGIGAMLAQTPDKFATVPGLKPEELEVLQNEFAHRWSQPWTMYLVVALCSVSAAVQGMDETVVNGAQLFYKLQFGLKEGDRTSDWLTGLVNAAPYLCCAVISCWLTVPFNAWFGRRGTIFITCCISAITCFWQGFVNTWWHMFIARFALGFGIGPKSATVPVYAAETAPPAIRGALVMQWQMWTAFGIMLGYAADLIFYDIKDPAGIVGLQWRLMMGSAMLPAIVVCCFVFRCPESPRWYMQRDRYDKAYQSMCRLRFNKVQAARDMYYMYTLLQAESSMKLGRNKMLELITVPRNRRAVIASELVMFLQQFCGVNVLAYYSTQIFVMLGDVHIRTALVASFGWGVINWLFAIPAVYTIDTFGRRNLLLATFPLMAAFMFFIGWSHSIPEASTHARLACIALGSYLFCAVYSTGEGPVPFTYSAEVYPLYVRSYGMALATATTWLFNFILAVSWPSLQSSFKSQGAFSFYGAWNIVGWFAILLFMPETKGRTLEELDQIFSVPTRLHAQYGLRQIPYFIKRYILRQRVRAEVLYERADAHAVPTDAGYNA